MEKNISAFSKVFLDEIPEPNGKYYVKENSFSNENKQIRQSLKVVYESKFGRAGIASLTVKVLRRNLPGNRERIEQLQTMSQEFNEKILVDFSSKSMLEAQNKILEAGLNTNYKSEQEKKTAIIRQINQLESQIREFSEKIKNIEKKCEEAKVKLASAKEGYEANKNIYSNVYQMAKVFNFKNSLIDVFKAEYIKLERINRGERPYGQDDMPEVYMCPIGLRVMNDPVSNEICGHTFERIEIERYVESGHNASCPCCRSPLDNISPNFALKNAIEEWKKLQAQSSDNRSPLNKFAPLNKSTSDEQGIQPEVDINATCLSLGDLQDKEQIMRAKIASLEHQLDELVKEHKGIIKQIDRLKVPSVSQNAINQYGLFPVNQRVIHQQQPQDDFSMDVDIDDSNHQANEPFVDIPELEEELALFQAEEAQRGGFKRSAQQET